MPPIDCQRPPKLYLYSERRYLERALATGEFRLTPAADTILEMGAARGGATLPPAGSGSMSHATYLTLSMSQAWDEALFDEYAGADCCLVIHRAEEFGERIHRAAARVLPDWAGIDAAVSYGISSILGAAFSKARQYARQQEWLFAWRPREPTMSLNPVVIRIGNIEAIAELRPRPEARSA
jgi:hypothetical protein